MSSEPASPKLRSIVIGIGLVLIATVLMCSLGDVLKTVGSPFLLIPGALGLVRTVSQDDVNPIDMASSPTKMWLPEAGTYAIYVDDIDLLSVTDALIDSKGNPWLKVKAVDTGETITTHFIERGLRVYDTPFAKGRPVIDFTIARAGTYELTHLRRNVKASIVPDYTTGHEALLTLIYLVQIALIAGLGVFFWRRRDRQERAAAKERQTAWIKRANVYWGKRAAREREGQQKRNSK